MSLIQQDFDATMIDREPTQMHTIEHDFDALMLDDKPNDLTQIPSIQQYSDNLMLDSEPTEPTGFAKMPAEVKLNILGNLGRKDLKACRLLDGHTSSVATSLLHESLCLAPTSTSTRRLTHFAQHPHLCEHVRNIELHPYHLRAIQSVEQFLEFCPEVDPSAESVDDDVAGNIKSRFMAYQAALDSEDQFHQDADQQTQSFTAGLNFNLRRFRRLEKVIYADSWTQNVRGFSEARPDSEYHQTIGVTELDGVRGLMHWSFLTRLLRDTKLKALELRSLVWAGFGPAVLEEADLSCFASLRSLTLTFDTNHPEGSADGYDRLTRDTIIGPLATLSQYLPNVQQLCLGFRDVDAPVIEKNSDIQLGPLADNILQDMTTALLSNNFGQLEAITLQNLVGSEDAVVAFVQRHRATLKTVVIDGFRQCNGEDNAKGVFDGVMRLAQGVRQNADLERFELRGGYVDASGPTLTFGNGVRSGVLAAIQDYVCRGEEFPASAFNMLVDKVWRGEKTACGNDVVYAEGEMELRMTLFAMIGGRRQYVRPSGRFLEGLRQALEMAKGMSGVDVVGRRPPVNLQRREL